MCEEHKNHVKDAIASLSLGCQYLNVAENQLQQTVQFGNISSLGFHDGVVDWKKYDQMTSSSDFNVIIPSLYCVYHGIELILKSLLLLNGIQPDTTKRGHDLSYLFKAVLDCDDVPLVVKEHFKYFLNSKEGYVGDFLKQNNKSIDNVSETLRYPNNKNFTLILDYTNLMHQEGKLIPYINELLGNCNTLRIEAVKYFREKELE